METFHGTSEKSSTQQYWVSFLSNIGKWKSFISTESLSLITSFWVDFYIRSCDCLKKKKKVLSSPEVHHISCENILRNLYCSNSSPWSLIRQATISLCDKNRLNNYSIYNNHTSCLSIPSACSSLLRSRLAMCSCVSMY